MATPDLWEEIWEVLDPSDLPSDLGYIARAQGMDAARQLVEVAGGGNLSVPENAEGAHMEAIARHLPGPLIAHLRTDWHGTLIYIPSRSSIIRIYREAYLLREWTGDNEYTLAQRYEVSVVRMRQLIREAVADTQTELELS